MAQVTGFVESVGIGGRIRPDCWTPLVVNLTSQISEPATYQIQVWQEDLDKDPVVYTKEITLSPKLQEKFELYFVPQPTGLPALPGQVTPNELQKALRVRVCLPPGEGKKPSDAKVVVDRLPVTFVVTDVDPKMDNPRGTRLVVWVTDGSSAPAFSGYQKVAGVGRGCGSGASASGGFGREFPVL